MGQKTKSRRLLWTLRSANVFEEKIEKVFCLLAKMLPTKLIELSFLGTCFPGKKLCRREKL